MNEDALATDRNDTACAITADSEDAMTRGSARIQEEVPLAVWPEARWHAVKRLAASVLAVGALTAGAFACTGTGDEGKLPPDIPDPVAQQTPAGAVARYNATLAVMPRTVDNLAALIGLLTDELTGMPAPLYSSYSPYTELDSRQDLTAFDSSFGQLHDIRGQAQEARGFLRAYAPDISPALVGHLFAVEGYTDLLLAETFCSGIPLSTVDFNGDYTLTAGFTSTEVYSRVLALLDSAAALVGDSARLGSFVAVERGRTLLALDRYADAAVAVSSVSTDFKYQATYTTGDVVNGSRVISDRLLTNFYEHTDNARATPTVADSEGGIGFAYRTSEDPRVPVTVGGSDPVGTKYFPAKYPMDGQVTVTLADGVEARLIEAEVALKLHPDDGSWLVTLNTLRTDGTFDTQPTPDETDDPAALDTLWHAGTGGVAGLDTLSDPGTAVARQNLLFRERAFWLYLTAHRQGDLRRLIRQYGRSATATYPSGRYQGGGAKGVYGDELVPSVPLSEQQLNPKYAGCIDRNP